jgi:hypothetical protein
MTMDFRSDRSLSDTLRDELNARLSARYKLKNFANDTGLKYYSLWRFMNQKPVTNQLLDELYAVLAQTSL